MPVEVSLTIPDAVGIIKSSRPIVYVLVRNQSYDMYVYAEKYTYKVAADMRIDLTLPAHFNTQESNLRWLISEKSETIRISITPMEIGEFGISVTAENLESDFYSTNIVTIRVEPTFEKANKWLEQYR